MPVDSPDPAVGEPLSADYHVIKNQTPDWLIHASESTREAFKRAPRPLDWLASLTAEQRRQLKQYNQASAQSQQLADQAMADLQDLETFAKPLLERALKIQFNVELDVNASYVHLRKPLALGVFGVKAGDFSVLTLSLLQAALHNFEDGECAAGAFDSSSRFRAGPNSMAQTIDSPLSIHGFLRLCRNLDVGAQYQTYLKAFLLPANTDADNALRQKVIRAQKDALQAAAYLALLKQDIEPGDYAVVRSVIDDQREIDQNGTPVWFCDLSIMGLRLWGCTVFVPVEKYKYAKELLVYIPHDPLHPLKKYPSPQAMEAELTRQLMAGTEQVPAGAGPTPYQRFLGQYVAYVDQPTYFSRLTEDAQDAPKNPVRQFVMPIVSALVSIWLSPQGLPPKAAVPQEPIKNPKFYVRVISKGGLWAKNVDLWPDNYAKLRDKLIADARHHGVPTADVDAKARARKIAALEQIGLFALNLVSMLVPVLGEVMMGVMAGQLLYETFDGAIEWSEGDQQAALEHMTDVAQNLAMLALMTGGGVLLRRLTTPAVIEGTKPVTLPSGAQKLWKTDLTPYKAAIELAPDAQPDALGLYTHEGRTVLPLEGDHYWLKQDPDSGQYRIQHPTRADAYAPRVEHNHDGGWQHEGEAPLTWDGPTLLRRLGQPAEALSGERLQQASEASGIDAETLRAARVDQEPVPLVLADSLRRIRIHDQLDTFVERMKSPDPAVYAQAETALQLDIMKRRGLLSSTPSLRVVERSGRLLWDDPAPSSSARRAVVLTDGGLERGELLQEVLYTLQGDDPQLKEFAGRPEDSLAQRATLLRQMLGDYVQTYKGALAEERYQAQTHSDDPDVARLLQTYPKLPTAIAEHLLDGASPQTRQALRGGAALPEEFDAQARWHEQEARVSRAYEGLFLDPFAELDSQRLALHSLETLPGWRQGTRLELRQYSATGQVLDAIGASDATEVKTLVLNDNGQFEGPMPRDFYTATWHLLTSEQRQALGMTEAGQLKSAIARSPMPRERLRAILLEHPVLKPSDDPTWRLLGGGRGIQQLVADAANVFRSPTARVRRLYPAFEASEVAELIQGMGDDVRGTLARLEAEYATLERDLKVWVRANAVQSSRTAFDRQGGFAQTVANQIKRCWRRETGGELHINAVQPLNLPALSADFSHVESLSLINTPWSADAQTFFNQFKQLKQLRINQAGLSELPQGLGECKDLTHLLLRGNRIQLTSQSVEQLGGLSQLVTLDLSGNPLGTPPDFHAMPRLEYVDLSETGIEQWPTGLREQTDLKRLDLRENQLRTVPHEHLYPPAEHFEQVVKINSVTALGGNPFSDEAALEVDNYWRRLGQSHPQWVASGIADGFSIETPMIKQVLRLFPEYSIRQAREYVWSLGEAGAAELRQRAEEFEILTQQLNAWVFSGGGARQRYVRMGAVLENVASRDDRYLAKARIVNCWRRQTLPKIAADGTPIGLELDLSGLTLPSLPDLDADFSHVGSLKLSGMNLSASPEGFLARHRGVRWLDLSNNQLRELPPALSEMNGLTRLFLHNNQISLNPETAQILAQRTTLRALWLDGNPLGITPDFSQIPDMRSLSLRSTGIDTWPSGLAEQPRLDLVDLADNRISTLPDAVIAPAEAQLRASARINNVVNLSNNPLSEATLEQVRTYSARLALAELTPVGTANRLVVTALSGGAALPPSLVAGQPFQRWTRGLAPEQIATRKTQWLGLRGEDGSDGFFRMLADLEAADSVHEDLQRRVWEVVDSITQNTAESEALRRQMFEWAGRAACCDRAALSFSNVEVMTLVYNARALATDESQGAALMKLSRGLFRLDEVEKTALTDIAARKAAINDAPGASAADKRRMIAGLEEVEIRLAYRFGLKDPQRLDLPGQPQQVRFTSMANVTPQMLDNAYQRIIQLNDSPEEFQALVSRDFWQDYVTHKYRAQFEAQSQPYQERLAALHDHVEAGQLSAMAYEAQAKDMQAQLAIEEANLIESLTRTELADSVHEQGAGQQADDEAQNRK